MARRKEITPTAKTPARIQAEAEYRRERGRIMATIRRVKKAGYEFDDNLFIPSRVSDLSNLKTVSLKAQTRALKKIGTKEIRFQATNLTEFDKARQKHDELVPRAKRKLAQTRRQMERDFEKLKAKLEADKAEYLALREKLGLGEEVTGPLDLGLKQQVEQDVEEIEITEIPEAVVNPNAQLWSKRQKIDPLFGSQSDFEIEREYQKEVRKYNRAYAKAKQADPSLTKDEFDLRWRKMKEDAEVLKRARVELQFKGRFEVGRSAYNQVLNMIKDVDALHKDSADYLKKLLDNEIKTYGEEAVLKNIAQSPDYLIEAATITLYYKEGSSSFNRAVSAIQQIIKGDIPSASETAQLAEITETAEDDTEELE